MAQHEQYVVDGQGKRIGVILEPAEYRKLLEDREELESIRAYDAAKASGEQAVPLDEAIAAVERDRR